MAIFQGSAVALVTPFTSDGIDWKAFADLVEYQITNGTKALFVCGTTGEPSTMTTEEKSAAIAFVVKQTNKRVPVFAGTGGNNTAESIKSSIAAEKLGVDGLLVVTPYYNKCTQKGLIAHYTAIADSVHTPIMMYNVPARTGVNINPATALALSAHPNIVAIKEASGNIDQITEIARLTHGKLDLYSGDDGVIVPLVALGGVGVVSVVANAIPRLVANLLDACLSGNFVEARALQFAMAPFVKSCFTEVNPIPIKTCMSLLGMMEENLRLPLCTMESATRNNLIDEMKKLNLLA